MRKDPAARRASLKDLFAARQLYLRSGQGSQYVVLSRRIQIGAALGLCAVLVWLGAASYAWVGALRQRESVDRALRAASSQAAELSA
ncbi:MAG: hypothetical protein ACREH6_12025, partial [Geminicoccaceae bacterium]